MAADILGSMFGIMIALTQHRDLRVAAMYRRLASLKPTAANSPPREQSRPPLPARGDPEPGSDRTHVTQPAAKQALTRAAIIEAGAGRGLPGSSMRQILKPCRRQSPRRHRRLAPFWPPRRRRGRCPVPTCRRRSGSPHEFSPPHAKPARLPPPRRSRPTRPRGQLFWPHANTEGKFSTWQRNSLTALATISAAAIAVVDRTNGINAD